MPKISQTRATVNNVLLLAEMALKSDNSMHHDRLVELLAGAKPEVVKMVRRYYRFVMYHHAHTSDHTRIVAGIATVGLHYAGRINLTPPWKRSRR